MCEPKRSVLPGVLTVAAAVVAAPAVAAVAAVAGGVLVALSVAEAAAAVLLCAVVYVRVRPPQRRAQAQPALPAGSSLMLEAAQPRVYVITDARERTGHEVARQAARHDR